MRQVPEYWLMAKGRVSRHFQHFFTLLGLSFAVCQRQAASSKLSKLLATCKYVLIFIPDCASDEFVTQHLITTKAGRVHFSWSEVSALGYGTLRWGDNTRGVAAK